MTYKTTKTKNLNIEEFMKRVKLKNIKNNDIGELGYIKEFFEYAKDINFHLKNDEVEKLYEQAKDRMEKRKALKKRFKVRDIIKSACDSLNKRRLDENKDIEAIYDNYKVSVKGADYRISIIKFKRFDNKNHTENDILVKNLGKWGRRIVRLTKDDMNDKGRIIYESRVDDIYQRPRKLLNKISTAISIIEEMKK